MSSKENPEIIKFIFQEVENHPRNIATLTANHFGISRVTANHYLQKLISKKMLSCEGTTKARVYQLIDFIDETFKLPINKKVEEHMIWRDKLLPFFKDVKENIIHICQYGFTEMLNNVIDHSESLNCLIKLKRNANRISITISDFGIGIFEKICRTYQLTDPRHALLELSKGKLTTDPMHHAGEGIFFTSRLFTEFIMMSDELYYGRKMQDGEDWLLEIKDHEKIQGTCIYLEISVDASHTTTEVFDKYTNDEWGFSRTHVPILLARYGNEQLVSRSQARRVLARFEKFSEIMLDFYAVEQIGQPFADEIFRVFQKEHPEIEIKTLHVSSQIKKMIKYVTHSRS